MTNHVIQPTTLQFSKALRLSSQPLLCVWRASALCLRVQDGARSRRAAGGDIESPPEKINNALVCKWPVLILRLSRRLELLWPLTGADRLCLREIPSHRWHHCAGERGTEWARTKGSILNQNLPQDHVLIFIPLTSFAAWFYLQEHSVFSQRVQLPLWPIRTLIRPLCFHEEESFNLHLLVF